MSDQLYKETAAFLRSRLAQKDFAFNEIYDFLITDDFIEFTKEFVIVLNRFSKTDLNSIGTGKESEEAKHFINLWNLAAKNGIPDITNEQINFWSGKKAFLRAFNSKGEISSEHVPIMSLMFKCLPILGELQLKNHLISEGLSKIYALKAKGNVNVYISSNKEEEMSGLKVGNHFWNAELPTLQRKLAKGEIDSIQINLYNAKTQSWEKPINLNSKEANGLLFISKRDPGNQQHPMPVGVLKKMILHWKNQAAKKGKERKEKVEKQKKETSSKVPDKVQKKPPKILYYLEKLEKKLGSTHIKKSRSKKNKKPG